MSTNKNKITIDFDESFYEEILADILDDTKLTPFQFNLIKSYYGKFDYSFEVKYLINCILNNPKYIGGTDSLDSRIMSISNKKVFCKSNIIKSNKSCC